MAAGFERFRNGIGLILAASVFLSLFDPAIAWFMLPAAIGGLMVAGTLFFIHRGNHLTHLEDTTDASGFLTPGGMFNLSSVSPTGIGGLGLSVMAVIAALNYREGQYLLGAGLIGGTLIAITMIRYRRAHGPTQHPLPLRLTNGRNDQR